MARNGLVSQQSYQPLCGIMPIAYAFSSFLKIICVQQQFDISEVRNHLYHCLKNNVLEPFPTLFWQQLSHFSNYNLLDKYFVDQQKFQNLHFEKNEPCSSWKQKQYSAQHSCLWENFSSRTKAKHRMCFLRQQIRVNKD